MWDFGISDVPLSWIAKTLESTVIRYLKKWSGLSRTADPSRLFLPKKNGGLNLSNITTLYKKMKVSIAAQLLTSRDPVTQLVAKKQTQKEQSQKRVKFHPMLTTREVIAADPGARRNNIITKRVCKDIDSKYGCGEKVISCQFTNYSREAASAGG